MKVTDPSGATIYGQQSDQALSAQGQQATAKIQYGPIPMQEMRLLPQFSQLGLTRPFGPGEAIVMPDGGTTSEETVTVPMGGRWAVLPSLWLINGVPNRVTEDHATQLAQQSGLLWPYIFNTQQEADAYATHREATWERTPQSVTMTTAQPALWGFPQP
jgi:hypothetical protein